MWGVKRALKTPVLSVMGPPVRIDVGSKKGPLKARILDGRWPQTPVVCTHLMDFNVIYKAMITLDCYYFSHNVNV